MKKLFTTALLSLAGLAVTTSQASAFFNCCGWRCCNKYSAKICVRPYNAFTPTCFGTITGIGCNPMNFGGPTWNGPACGPSCGPVCCSSGGCDSGFLGQLPGPIGLPA